MPNCVLDTRKIVSTETPGLILGVFLFPTLELPHVSLHGIIVIALTGGDRGLSRAFDQAANLLRDVHTFCQRHAQDLLVLSLTQQQTDPLAQSWLCSRSPHRSSPFSGPEKAETLACVAQDPPRKLHAPHVHWTVTDREDARRSHLPRRVPQHVPILFHVSS
jgi:hypothetical protein